MIVSLGNIVRQWIQKCLVGDGLLLGLVGSESSLSNLALLVSPEFRAAISCSVALLCDQGEGKYQRRRQGRALVLILGSLSLGCLLCSLAGPASAVLMIPRYDWFEKEVISKVSEPNSYSFLHALVGSQQGTMHYPDIFIAPQLDSNGISRRGLNFTRDSHYWADALRSRNPSINSSYFYPDINRLWQTRVDITTSFNRTLVLDSHWQGATLLTGVMERDLFSTIERVASTEASSDIENPHIKFSAQVTGVEVMSVCRRRRKIQCSHFKDAIEESAEWCYEFVTGDSSDGQLQSSKDLLLVSGHSGSGSTRVWMTEGQPTIHTEFSDSIVIVLEEILGEKFKDPSLIVCSVFATFKPVTIGLLIQLRSPEYFDFREYTTNFNGNFTSEHNPRMLRYHRSWLESIHGELPGLSNKSQNKSSNESSKNSNPCRYIVGKTYPCRGQLNKSGNMPLRDWSHAIRSAGAFNTSSRSSTWWKPDILIEASTIETIIGGSFISELLKIGPSPSQYPQDYVPYAQPGLNDSLGFPKGLMIEPVEDYTQYVLPPIKVYRLVYGFRIWSRTSILSVIVLIMHTTLILGGSVWQIRRGSLIQAWGSMSEYVMLCHGSKPASSSSGVENTCAGISCHETLNRVVRIREVTKDHLELVFVAPDTKLLGSVVDPEKRYGFSGEKRRRTKEKRE